MKRYSEPAHSVSVERDGKTYKADYRVENGCITVETLWGYKSTQLGGQKEEALAEVLLDELIDEGKVRPSQVNQKN